MVGCRERHETTHLGKFKVAFDAQFYPKAFKEAKRVEFGGLVQRNMSVIEY